MHPLCLQKPEGIVNEALQQIAYADRIVLNKIDLVSPEQLENLDLRLRSINSLAQVKDKALGGKRGPQATGWTIYRLAVSQSLRSRA